MIQNIKQKGLIIASLMLATTNGILSWYLRLEV